MIFFTSDLHFGHKNIIEYCNRSYSSVEEMNKDIVRKWNNTVSDTDTVFILGDIAMGQIDDSLRYVEMLNGDIYATVGNHDRIFDSGLTKGRAKWERLYPTWIAKYADVGVQFIEDGFLAVNGEVMDDIYISHFPYEGDSTDALRYAHARPPRVDGWLLHGHIHDERGISYDTREFNVGFDIWGQPIPLEMILGFIR